MIPGFHLSANVQSKDKDLAEKCNGACQKREEKRAFEINAVCRTKHSLW